MSLLPGIITGVGSAIGQTVGKVIAKVIDYIPDRGEALRRKRRHLEDAINEELSKPKHLRDYDLFVKWSNKLSELNKTLSDKA